MSEVLEIKERICAMQQRINELEGRLFDMNTFLDMWHNWDHEKDAENRARLLVHMKNMHRRLTK